MKKILVGSSAFFSGMKGFNGKENFINVVDDAKPHGANWWSKRGEDTFEWVRHTKDELLKKLKSTGVIKRTCAIIVPEIADEFGITIDDVKQFEHTFDKCEGKLAFYKVIFEAYMENNAFTLTDEQKEKAFSVYLDGRK